MDLQVLIERLKKFRYGRPNLAEIAKMADLTPFTITRIVTGKTKDPAYETVMRIMWALDKAEEMRKEAETSSAG